MVEGESAPGVPHPVRFQFVDLRAREQGEVAHVHGLLVVARRVREDQLDRSGRDGRRDRRLERQAQFVIPLHNAHDCLRDLDVPDGGLDVGRSVGRRDPIAVLCDGYENFVTLRFVLGSYALPGVVED